MKCAAKRGSSCLLGLTLLACIAQVHARAWVYTFVPADHGGDLLLPHFINYYHQLGITYRRFLVLVHHTPGKHPRAALERIAGICEGYSLECRLWEGTYSPDQHLQRQLQLLKDYIDEPLDWVLAADVNELQEWPTDNVNQYLVDEGAETQVSFYMGEYVDRMARGGALQKVAMADNQPASSLFAQFPLRCLSQESLGGAQPKQRVKVVAFKNFLRAGRGRQRVITPDAARSYFGKCTPVRLCPRLALEGPAAVLDMFNLTPYSWYQDRYRYIGTPPDVRGEKYFWPYKATPPRRGHSVLVHHFKWHAGAVNLTLEQLERYRGNCNTYAPSAACRPLLPRWRQALRTWQEMKYTQRASVRGMDCEEDARGAVTVNTAYMGLAWEEFERGLKVVSRVRNKVKGDSRTRLAGMLKVGAEDAAA